MVMKKTFIGKVLLIICTLIVCSCQPKKETSREIIPVNDISGFLGQWTFDIGKNQVGWLEVKQENGYIDADLLWGGGSVLPVPYLFMSNGNLIVGRDNRKIVRTKDENGIEKRVHQFPSWVEFTVKEGKISGLALRPKSSGMGLDCLLLRI
jgi:hypothetical protein